MRFCLALLTGAGLLIAQAAREPAWGQAADGAPGAMAGESGGEPLPADCLSSSELRPGMVGVGKTVFQGFKPGTFKAEILGVQRSAMAHGNMIVARLSGPLLEQHGVVAGMSGSPVFVNGKTIGAVAYGWTFAYKPYCGITPIESMWSVWQSIGRKGLTEAGQESASEARLAEGTPWNWRPELQRYLDRCEGKAQPLSAALSFTPDLPELKGVPGELKPLTSPVFLSGGSPRTEARLRNWFASDGVDVMGTGSMMGGGSAPAREPAPEIEDGSGLGVPMVTGDLNLGSIGTVTYRRGDKLIAFGHPMFSRGGVRAPMSATYIFGFMQSYQRSFKLGETREEVGVVDQDRLFAIGGKFGEHAPRIPMSVTVSGAAAFRPRVYRYSVWDDNQMLPMLVSTLIGEAYSSSVAEGGRLTARAEYELKLADGRVVKKRFFSSDEGTGVIDDAGNGLLSDAFMVLRNPYRKGDLASITMNIDVEPGLRQDAMLAMTSERTQYEPGETVRLTGRFRPYRGEEYRRSFEFKLPADLDEDSYVIHLTDAAGTSRVRQANAPAVYNPRSYADVLTLLQANAPDGDHLHLWLFRPEQATSINGQSLAGLPASLAGIVDSTAPDDKEDKPVGRLMMDQPFSVPAPVSGSQSVTIQVVKHINQ